MTLLATLALGLTREAHGEAFSIDTGSATTGGPITPGDILTPTGASPPPVLIAEASIPAPGIDLDALSNGNEAIPVPGHTLFSVDRTSFGLPFTGVALEAAGTVAPGDQSADIFTWFAPGLNVQTRDGDGIPNPGPGTPPVLGLVEPGGADRLDAFDLDMTGHPVYFSFSPAGAPIGAFGPEDVLFSGGPGGPVTLFASGVAPGGLGLAPGDDLDALSLLDADGTTTFTPGDAIFYSLAPGSPTLGLLGASAADILTTPAPGGSPGVFVTASALGLLFEDNVDALTVVPVPEPSTLVLAACGALALVACRHRRKAALTRLPTTESRHLRT